MWCLRVDFENEQPQESAKVCNSKTVVLFPIFTILHFMCFGSDPNFKNSIRLTPAKNGAYDKRERKYLILSNPVTNEIRIRIGIGFGIGCGNDLYFYYITFFLLDLYISYY